MTMKDYYMNEAKTYLITNERAGELRRALSDATEADPDPDPDPDPDIDGLIMHLSEYERGDARDMCMIAIQPEDDELAPGIRLSEYGTEVTPQGTFDVITH